MLKKARIRIEMYDEDSGWMQSSDDLILRWDTVKLINLLSFTFTFVHFGISNAIVSPMYRLSINYWKTGYTGVVTVMYGGTELSPLPPGEMSILTGNYNNFCQRMMGSAKSFHPFIITNTDDDTKSVEIEEIYRMAVNKLLTIEYKCKITSTTYGNLLKNTVV